MHAPYSLAGKLVYWSVVQIARFFGTGLLKIEWGIALAACLYPLLRLPVPRWTHGLRTFAARLSRRRPAAVALCGALPLLLRALLLPVAPVAPPSVHDEFSELLLADTLASGRLTNPTHPLWQHFESIHIVQRPTYNSMYQPAFGAFLALGQAAAGVPWLGVWLATGLMSAALCWMLQGWLPPAWALTGGLLAVFTIGIPGYWMNSYFGGSVPALGGALALGALARFTNRSQTPAPQANPGQAPRPLHALAMGAGFALLLGSRPFEGGILGLATAVILLGWWGTRGLLWNGLLRPRLLAPFFLILVPALLFTGYYSWRVTANPLKMPYELNRETYGWPENLAILPPVRVVYRHQALKEMHLEELSHREVYSKFGRTVDTLFHRLLTGWEFYIGPALTLPLLFLPLVVRDRRTRMPALLALFMCSVNLLQLMLYPQHIAAITGLIFLIVTQGLRHLRIALVRGRSPSMDARFALSFALAILLASGVRLFAEPLGANPQFWEVPRQAHRDWRAALSVNLAGRPGPQLAIVRYRRDHDPNQEWVYNAADIDRAKIVWAREMDPASNQALLRYFACREAWLVEADERPPRVAPYPLPEQSPAGCSSPTSSARASAR